MFFRTPWVRLYSGLSRIQTIYRYSISGVVLLLLFSFWRITILTALEQTYKSYQSEVDDLKNHKKLLENIKVNNGFLNTAILNLKERLKILPTQKQSLGNNIDFIFNQAAQSGLMIDMCLPQDELDLGWCYEHTFFFDINGPFENIKHFFDQISQQKRMIRCSRLYITKLDAHQLKIACILNFYVPKLTREISDE